METQPEGVAAAKPKRRWFQFSLAKLLLLMLVCAVVLAMFVAPAERQHRAVEYIESLGGSVQYGNEGDEPAFVPTRLREWPGQDCFHSVKMVRLNGSLVCDSGLAHLEGLTALRRLDLSYTQVSNAGLAHLKGLTALESLTLHNTEVSNAGLSYLKGLTALESLTLGDTQVSDSGLAHLEGLTALEWLDLSFTQVSDAGLAHLKRLTALELLNLYGAQVSETGITELRAALPNCVIDY